MEKQTTRVRRVGSATFGIVLIVLGTLFITHSLFPDLDIRFIIKGWPLILIMLGVETLLGCRNKSYQVQNEKGEIVEQNKMVYDFTAIFLTFVLTGFSCCMALIEWAYANGSTYITF